MVRKAFITGATGQDGSYLAELLLLKGYEVYCLVRRSSVGNLDRLEHIKDRIVIVEGDMLDESSLDNAIMQVQPTEVYNLAAQSFVATSWKQPVLTADVDALGTLRLLEAVRRHAPSAKFYQASTSEMYGNAESTVQDEQTTFRPRSPYAISKLFAHWIAVNYRESYGLFVCCGILFNHESERRGFEFVTRKISDGVARIKLGLADHISLGNLDSKRDWGYAGDYVEAMWLMLQQKTPEDYVISTGKTHTVRDFVRAAFDVVGIQDWEKYVRQDSQFMRPAELYVLQGNPNKAMTKLGWKPRTGFGELVELMVNSDLKRLKEELS